MQCKTSHKRANRRLFVAFNKSPVNSEHPLIITDNLSNELFPERLFVPYSRQILNPRALHDRLVHELSKDLNASASAGSVYAYTDDSLPGYVEVGCISNSIEDRIIAQRRCKFETTTELDLLQRETPCHQKLERLVYTELAAYRWIMLSCKGCGKTHTEWFGIDVTTDFEVEERWGKWLALNVYVERRLDDV